MPGPTCRAPTPGLDVNGMIATFAHSRQGTQEWK